MELLIDKQDIGLSLFFLLVAEESSGPASVLHVLLLLHQKKGKKMEFT